MQMKTIDRRGFVAAAGVSLSSLAFLPRQSDVCAVTGESSTHPWRYEALDPADTAALAYDLFPHGHCMQAAFASIVSQLATRLGEPYRSFPLDMMLYGMGGLASAGALCGAINGAAAAIGLFTVYGEGGAERIRELCRWYEQASLPVFVPRAAAERQTVPRSIAKSLQCRESAASWCTLSGLPFSHPLRAERCRRLTADVARKTVELLNASVKGRPAANAKSSK